MIETMKKGWPQSRQDTHPSIRQYWPLRDELFEAEGLVFKDERVIVPSTMRQDMLNKLHESHLGMEKCKS